ncbi:MAG: glycoside hydrolase family 97 N-terminal domain-containing protein, partial [Prevotella sp.]
MQKKIIAMMLFVAAGIQAAAQALSVGSPDGRLKVAVTTDNGHAFYSISYDGKQMMEPSRLGLVTDVADLDGGLTLTGHEERSIDTLYNMRGTKVSQVRYRANELVVAFANGKKQTMNVIFRVSDNDVAFRYSLPAYGDRRCLVVKSESTSFRLPDGTTTFVCAQSDAMIGWQRTKPSYEETYAPDAPMTQRSQYGHGFTFPCLFHVGDKGWVLVSETGTDGSYAGCHLSDFSPETGYTVALPMPGEANGIGSSEVGMALPGSTPWRTVTVGATLAPIVETTVSYDVVTPRYEADAANRPGRYTWSWLI